MSLYYYQTNGRIKGPVHLQELRDLLKSGGVTAQDKVWTDGGNTTQSVADLLATCDGAKPFSSHKPTNNNALPITYDKDVVVYGNVTRMRKGLFGRIISISFSVIGMGILGLLFGLWGLIFGLVSLLFAIGAGRPSASGGWNGTCPRCKSTLLMPDPNKSAILVAPLRLICPSCEQPLEISRNEIRCIEPV